VPAGSISKQDLLTLVAKQYQTPIQLIQDEQVSIDRSLDASRFNQRVGFDPPDWRWLVETMHDDYLKLKKQHV
jgi:dTDP-4-dehydrorhamnose reductase